MKKNPLLFSFVICSILGAFIVIPNIICSGGIYHLTADFDFQEIPFHMIMNNSIKNGNFLFTWFNDLGSNFIGTFSFYNLFSPFNIFELLFSSNLIPYLLGPMYILKYGICGVCSCLYLKRYVKDSKYAIIGSILYTFSGYQLTNILFYHFHDSVALFPLLLWGLDEFFYNNKKGALLITIFLQAITNWFFFIGEIIFLAIYFIIKVIKKDYYINKRNISTLLFEGLLGVLLASFVLIPSYLFIKTNPRVDTFWNFIDMFKYESNYYIELLRSFFFVPEVMFGRSFMDINNYSSVELYLPVIGSLFMISYLIKKPKDTFSIIIWISIILMFVPILNSAFVLFNNHYYARWFMMPILIMSLISIKSMEDGLCSKKSVVLTLICFLSVLSILIIYPLLKSFKVDSIRLMIIIITSVLFLVFSIIFFSKKRDNYLNIFIVLTSIYLLTYGNYMVYLYKSNSNSNINYSSIYKKSSKLNSLKNTRTNSIKCFPNIGLIQEIPDIYSFNSNISGEMFNFYKSINLGRAVATEINDEKLMYFLGVEKEITCFNKDDFYEINDLDHLNMGFVPKNIISKDDFSKLNDDDKIDTLLSTVVLDSIQINTYEQFVSKNNMVYTQFNYLKNGFSLDFNSNRTSLIVIQVPYDKGWNAYNNKNKITIENVDNGLIGVLVPEGRGTLIFKYHVPGLFVGIIISLLSFLTTILYIYKCKETI